MKEKATSKVLRAVLIVAVLVIALVGGALDKSSRVAAKSCVDAFADYMNANGTYEISRLSYFYGLPTTCQYDCRNDPNQPQCVNNCQIDRHTALGNADIALLSAAGETCTPETIDQCTQARAMADGCFAQYPYTYYSEPDEVGAVLEQYMACREASKVDSCQ